MSKPAWCPNPECEGGIVSLLTGYKCNKCGTQYNYFSLFSMEDLDDEQAEEFENSLPPQPLPKSFRQFSPDGGRTWKTVYDEE